MARRLSREDIMSNAQCNLEMGFGSVQDKTTEATRPINGQSGCWKLLEEASNWTVYEKGDLLICRKLQMLVGFQWAPSMMFSQCKFWKVTYWMWHLKNRLHQSEKLQCFVVRRNIPMIFQQIRLSDSWLKNLRAGDRALSIFPTLGHLWPRFNTVSYRNVLPKRHRTWGHLLWIWTMGHPTRLWHITTHDLFVSAASASAAPGENWLTQLTKYPKSR